MPRGKSKDNTAASVEDVIAELQKDGLNIGLTVQEQEWYTTGNMAIDAMIGGGIPKGKIVELAGPNASGKTTTAISTAAHIIAEGGRVAFFDYERAMDKGYFRALGVEPDDQAHFTYVAPSTLEQGANAARKLMRTGQFDLMIFDSVARMITEREKNGNVGDISVGERAKLMYQFLRQAVDDAADFGCTMIFLNHLLEKVDTTFMGQQMAARGIKQWTTPGGNALPFFASVRLFFTKRGQITSELVHPLTNEKTKVIVGNKHEIRVAKNKVGKPEGKAEVVNIMGEGFSQSRTAYEVLKAYGDVGSTGAWYSPKHPDLVTVPKTHGEENFYKKIFEAELRGTAIRLAYERLQEAYNGLADAPDEDEDVDLGDAASLLDGKAFGQ